MTKRVLIADDSEATRKVISTYLEQQPSLEVCAQTANGLEAVHAAIALRPDLIILDVRMPGLNGVEVAGILKKNLPKAKVVLFTMYADTFTKYLPSAVGASSVLSKSEGLSGLARKINDLLQIPEDPEAETSPAALNSMETDSQADSVRLLRTALQETEERFQATFEQTAVGMAHAAKDGHLLLVNRKFCEIVGHTRRELLQLTVEEITHPEDLASDLAQARRLSAGEIDRYTIDKRYLKKDGQIAWVRLTVNAVRDAAGKLQYCVRVAEELNELKEAQDHFDRTVRAHRVTAAHLNLLTEKTTAPLTHCSRDLKYLWVNQYYADWLHKPLDKIVGRPILDVIGKQAFETLHSHFDRVLRGEDVAYEATADYDVIGPRRISAAYKPTLTASGTPDGWVAFVQDITNGKG